MKKNAFFFFKCTHSCGQDLNASLTFFWMCDVEVVQNGNKNDLNISRKNLFFKSPTPKLGLWTNIYTDTCIVTITAISLIHIAISLKFRIIWLNCCFLLIQACSSLLFVRAFLPVNSQNACHPGVRTYLHHQQVSGLRGRPAGKAI